MKDGRSIPPATAGMLILGGALAGGLIGYAAFKPPVVPQSPPFNIDDARSVLAMLRPVSNGKTTGARIFLWADEEVTVAIDIPSGSSVRGSGRSLADAVTDLRKSSKDLGGQAAALSFAIAKGNP